MTYDALLVANYILEYAQSRNIPITNFKLQGILYFVQAEFLTVHSGEPCFDEPIIARDWGPMVPRVYRDFKVFGATVIPSRDPDSVRWRHFDTSEISEKDRALIEGIVRATGRYSTSRLLWIITRQKPWEIAHRRLLYSAPEAEVEISRESIMHFFKEVD